MKSSEILSSYKEFYFGKLQKQPKKDGQKREFRKLGKTPVFRNFSDRKKWAENGKNRRRRSAALAALEVTARRSVPIRCPQYSGGSAQPVPDEGGPRPHLSTTSCYRYGADGSGLGSSFNILLPFYAVPPYAGAPNPITAQITKHAQRAQSQGWSEGGQNADAILFAQRFGPTERKAKKFFWTVQQKI